MVRDRVRTGPSGALCLACRCLCIPQLLMLLPRRPTTTTRPNAQSHTCPNVHARRHTPARPPTCASPSAHTPLQTRRCCPCLLGRASAKKRTFNHPCVHRHQMHTKAEAGMEVCMHTQQKMCKCTLHVQRSLRHTSANHNQTHTHT